MIIDFLKERKDIMQIIVVSIFLAFGIRFIGQGLSEILDFKKIENIYFGLFFLLIPITFFAYALFKQKEKEYFVKGFIIYNKKTNQIIDIPEYEYGVKLKKYFNSSFAENKALEIIWNKYKIDDYEVPKNATTGRDLLFEATEYFFINKLSMHLMSYFSSEKFKSSKLHTFKRNDIPHILLDNSFLDLFSKSMGKRAAFVDTYDNNSNNPNIIDISAESNGHLYENFILILPKECKITKPSKNILEIKNNRIELRIEHEITGMTTLVSKNFIKYYTGNNDDSEFIKYTLDTNIRIKFTLLAFFSNLGWNYFKWVDSFIDRYEKSFSEQRFLNRINWNTIDNLINVTKRLNINK
jgi:hypothetical protein